MCNIHIPYNTIPVQCAVWRLFHMLCTCGSSPLLRANASHRPSPTNCDQRVCSSPCSVAARPTHQLRTGRVTSSRGQGGVGTMAAALDAALPDAWAAAGLALDALPEGGPFSMEELLTEEAAVPGGAWSPPWLYDSAAAPVVAAAQLRCLDATHPAGCTLCCAPPDSNSAVEFLDGSSKVLRGQLLASPEWESATAREAAAAAEEPGHGRPGRPGGRAPPQAWP